MNNPIDPYLRLSLSHLLNSATSQVIDALQSHPDQWQRLMKCLNVESKPRFAPVTPGRKPLWSKLQEEEYMNLELLARAGLGSPDEIYHKIARECERQQYIISEPAIPRNIFREYYYKTINKNNNVKIIFRRTKVPIGT